MTCAAFNNQPRGFLRNENHFYGIIVVHLTTSNTAFESRKTNAMSVTHFLYYFT